MYFTLAVSAATAAGCAALTAAAEDTDPRVMPIPGRARIVWHAPDQRAAMLHWGEGHRASASHAGTIWAEGATVRARTSLTRVDPVYLAEVAGAVVTSDRACWAAAVTGRLREPDPVMIGAFLSLGYPVGGSTAFRGVRTLGGDRELRADGGRLVVRRARPEDTAGGAAPVTAAELFRRMTTRRLSLLRPGPARAYLASLAPSAAALARGPLAALDDFYLVNRAGRWSAAARQAYLLRSPLVQPLFEDRVVRAARAVPLRDRVSDRLHRDVLGLLCPELLGIPLAGTPWHGEPGTPATVLTVPPGPARRDWRRDYGEATAGFLRGFVLDQGAASPMFGIVGRPAAERSLRSPQADPHAVWALATLAALLSGEWLNARAPASQALISRDRT